MIRKSLSVLMVLATLTVSTPKAHAIADSAIVTLAVTAATVITYLLGGSIASTEASSRKKEAALNVVADDAASFIMNEGENPSALLTTMMDQMRASDEVRAIKEEITDLDLARAILNEAEKEIQ